MGSIVLIGDALIIGYTVRKVHSSIKDALFIQKRQYFSCFLMITFVVVHDENIL